MNHIEILFRKVVITASVVLFFPLISFAQQYTNKENIPGQAPTSDFVTYLENLYGFGIGIAAILAIFMIAVGAFMYIFTSAGNVSKTLDAKETIKNALTGLVLALTAYLLLFIINPDLVGGTLNGPGDVLQKLLGGTGSINTNNTSVYVVDSGTSDGGGMAIIDDEESSSTEEHTSIIDEIGSIIDITVPAVPVLSFSSTSSSLMLGESTNLKWTVKDALYCKTSGSGFNPISFKDGDYSKVITPGLVGWNKYSLECFNSRGDSSGEKIVLIKVEGDPASVVKPIAKINSPSSSQFVYPGEVIRFSGEDMDGGVVDYEWRVDNCDSGTLLSTEDSFNHVFNEEGIYHVYFRVKNNKEVYSTCADVSIFVFDTTIATNNPNTSNDCGSCNSSTHECVPKVYSHLRIEETIDELSKGINTNTSNRDFYEVFNLYKEIGTNWDYKTALNQIGKNNSDTSVSDYVRYIEEFKDKSPGDDEAAYADVYLDTDGGIYDYEAILLNKGATPLYETPQNLSQVDLVDKYNEIINKTKDTVGQNEFEYMKDTLSSFTPSSEYTLTNIRHQGTNTKRESAQERLVLYKSAAGWKDTFIAKDYQQFLSDSVLGINPQESFIKKDLDYTMTHTAHFDEYSTIDAFPANLSFFPKPGHSGITGLDLFKVYIPPGVLALNTFPSLSEIATLDRREYAVRLGLPPSGEACDGKLSFSNTDFSSKEMSIVLDSGAEVYLDSEGDQLRILLDLDKTLNREGQYLYIKKCRKDLSNLKYFIDLWHSPDIVLHQAMSQDRYAWDEIDSAKVCSPKSMHAQTISVSGSQCDGVNDFDGDGYDCSVDCNDYNNEINPGIEEDINFEKGEFICYDHIDNDCDGLTDTREENCPINECRGYKPVLNLNKGVILGPEGAGTWTFVENSNPGLCEYTCAEDYHRVGNDCVETNPSVPGSCIEESDYGNYKIKGYVRGNFYNNGTEEFYDFCEDGKLTEYSCSMTNDLVIKKGIICKDVIPFGANYECIDGACVEQ